MDFNIKVTDEMLKDREKLANLLLQNSLVLDFLKSNELSNEVVKKYPYRFKGWLENISKCEGCKGLKDCKQPVEGEIQYLVFDGILKLEPKLCKYAKEDKNKRAHLSNFWINQMPEDNYNVMLSSIELINDDISNLMSNVLDNIQDENETKGLYIHGAVGVGKTYVACGVANYYAKNGKTVCFINVPKWISTMKGLIYDSFSFERQIEMMNKASIVVLDDIGAESVTPWVRDELLFPILNERMNNSKKTFFTSNDDFETLQIHFSHTSQLGEEKLKAERIMERIKKISKPFKFKGINRRNNV